MNQSEQNILFVNLYEKLDYTVDDGWTEQIPSPLILKELIHFPKVDQPYPDPSDPFNVDHYRIHTRSQEREIESQLLLLSRSNWVIERIKQQRLNPSLFEVALSEYCNRHSIDFESVHYRWELIKYCQKLLPGAGANPDKNSKILTAFQGMKPETGIGLQRTYDFTEPRLKSGEPNYFDRLDKSHESRKRRFSEFRWAVDYIDNLAKQPSFDEEMHQIILSQASEINKNHEKQKKHRANNRRNKATEEGGNGSNLDYRILTQCLFCHSFHLQEPKRVLSRFCDQPECKLNNKAWLESLQPSRKNIDTKTISPSGF